MQQGQGLSGPGDQLNMRQSFNLLGFAAICHATCLTPFFRKRFGAEALGFNGLFAFITMLMVAGSGGEVGMYYFLLWLMFLLLHRACSMKNERKGNVIHSRYAGDPWLARLVCRNDVFAKRYVEPALCFGVGLLLCYANETVGGFVMFGAVSLSIVQAIEWQLTRVRIQQMNDAEIEQRHFADLYRGRRGM